MNTQLLTALFASAPAVPMPPPDPAGYPLPPTILQVLSYTTLTLHLLAVQFTLGGLLLYLYSQLLKRPGYQASQQFIGSTLPLGMSYVITLGIPPLLFVQTLYGQMFYSSSVLVGQFWILVVPLLIGIYLSLYVHKLTRDGRASWQPLLLAVTAGAMILVGYIYVNNLTLSFRPDRWLELYRASPAGNTLNRGEPTIFPRLLTFLAPALGVAGLALILRGVHFRRHDRPDDAAHAQGLGAMACVAGLVLFAGGALWLHSQLPADIAKMLLAGGTPTTLLAAAAGGVVLGTALAVASRRASGYLLPVVASVCFAAGFGMAMVLRDQIRLEYLRPYFRLDSVPVHPQWGLLALFLVVTLVLFGFVAVVGVMVARQWSSRPSGERPAS